MKKLDHRVDDFFLVNENDEYGYSIRYALIPEKLVIGSVQTVTKTVNIDTEQKEFTTFNDTHENISPKPSSFNQRRTSVLGGFKFDFLRSDHHLQEIAVGMTNSALLVLYNDRNNDDSFKWEVNPVFLRPPDLTRR